ncbi:hypothetical protein HMPREF3190_00799 [Umbribacter vaginalis]|nr:hypothetical protein HMPREF3190_00799 [Coriobacteriales bacterium DNF00809]
MNKFRELAVCAIRCRRELVVCALWWHRELVVCAIWRWCYE